MAGALLAFGPQAMMAWIGLAITMLLGGFVLWQRQNLGAALVPWLAVCCGCLAMTVGLWLVPHGDHAGPPETLCLEPDASGRLQLRLDHGLVHLGQANGRSLGRFVARRGDAVLGQALSDAQQHCHGAPWAVVRAKGPGSIAGQWHSARVKDQQFLWLDARGQATGGEVFLGLPGDAWQARIDMNQGLIEKNSAAVRRLDVSLGYGRLVLFVPSPPHAMVSARLGLGVVEMPDSGLGRLELRGGHLQATLAAPVPGLLQAAAGRITLGDQLAMPVKVVLEGGARVDQEGQRLVRQGSAWMGGPADAPMLRISLGRGKVEWR